MTGSGPNMPQGNDRYKAENDFWLNLIARVVHNLGIQDMVKLEYKKLPDEEVAKIIFDKILSFRDYKSGLEIEREFHALIEKRNANTPKGDQKLLVTDHDMNVYVRLHRWETIDQLVESEWFDRGHTEVKERKKGYRKITGGQRVDSPEISGDESFGMA